MFHSRLDGEIRDRAFVRHLWRLGLRPGQRMTSSWPGGLYSGGGWTRAMRILDALDIPIGPPLSVQMAAEHIRLWQLFEPQVFMMTGSQLQTFEQAAETIGVDLASIFRGTHFAFLEASCQFDEPRQRIEAMYGMDIHNISGVSEIPGFMASDCIHHTGFHVGADQLVVQVCDPVTGQEVPDGERGHLVATCLGADSLWLRYDIEDYVEKVTGPCPCGETGTRYRLIGRGADAVHAGGRLIFPLDVQLALDAHGAPEFQLVKNDDGILRLRVEQPDGEPTVAELLAKALGCPVEVDGVPLNSLPRSSFKARRVG
jgi:phenylacetate-CoA ligase